MTEQISLNNKRLSYLLDRDEAEGSDNRITMLGYDAEKPCRLGISALYRNAFDEKNSGFWKPYLKDDDVSGTYHEGRIDPNGRGWVPHLENECKSALACGFKIIECFDNLDSYQDMSVVIHTTLIAQALGLQGLAKNPQLFDGQGHIYLAQPNIIGAICESSESSFAKPLDRMRRDAGKPNLPIYFVGKRRERYWTGEVANEIRRRNYKNMFVTWSSRGEYANSIDILGEAS